VPRALATAAAGVAILLMSQKVRSLPALGWAASLIFLFIVEDMRRRRIPNWLTLSGAGAGILVSAATAGWTGAAQAVAGVLVAFGLLLVPFALRGLGAGDVKALLALGSFWGPAAIAGSVPWMLIMGGLLALVVLGVRGELPAMLRRWALSLSTLRFTRKWIPATATAPGGGGLPFAVAIALGASAYQFWGPLWS
jgi:prepilin peptidase CpaA